MEHNKDTKPHSHNLDKPLDDGCRYDLANYILYDCDCECNLLNDVNDTYGFEEDKIPQFKSDGNLG